MSFFQTNNDPGKFTAQSGEMTTARNVSMTVDKGRRPVASRGPLNRGDVEETIASTRSRVPPDRLSISFYPNNEQ